ncbi:MAG: hypothetical protein IT562_02225 [Alphaproteobacteria bacterium]|nr:hypothetical protein [Alphaproteobacteria bacterium]
MAIQRLPAGTLAWIGLPSIDVRQGACVSIAATLDRSIEGSVCVSGAGWRSDRIVDRGRNPCRPAVLLVGHGSENIEDSCASIERLGDRLRGRPEFAAVATAYVRGGMPLERALQRLAVAGPICVVPMFAAEGHYTKSLVATKIAAARERWPQIEVQQIQALGLQPGYVATLAARTRQLARVAGIETGGATFLAIGHGSPRAPGLPDDAAARLARALRPHFAAVRALYLQCAPLASAWHGQVRTRDAVVAPVLFSDARHAIRDVPALFGLGGSLAGGDDRIAGPWPIDGKRIWYATLPPSAPDVADLIADLALGLRWTGGHRGAAAARPSSSNAS